MRPKFSVILPVCHRRQFLKQALSSLVAVSSPLGGFEIIIAGKKERTNNLSVFCAEQTALRLVESKGSRSDVLNAACAAACGSFLVFADDDCVFPKDWLVNIERSLIDHPDAAVLGGSDVLAPNASVFGLALDEVLNSFVGTGGMRRGSSVRTGRYYPRLWNMTVLADAAKQAALDGLEQRLIFDPSLDVHEDVDLTRRISARGGKVVYVPDVRVGHCRDTNFTSFFKRNIRMAQICRRLGIHRAAHSALITLMIGFPVMGVVSLVVEALKVFFLSAVGVYAAAVVLTGIKGAVKKKRAVLTGWIPVLMVSLHMARAVGYLFPLRIKEDFNP